MKQFIIILLKLLCALQGVLFVQSSSIEPYCDAYESGARYYQAGIPTAESQCPAETCSLFDPEFGLWLVNTQQAIIICLDSNGVEIARQIKDNTEVTRYLGVSIYDVDRTFTDCHSLDVELIALPGMSISYAFSHFQACIEESNCEFITCEECRTCSDACPGNEIIAMDYANRNFWSFPGSKGSNILKGSGSSITDLAFTIGSNVEGALLNVISGCFKFSCEKRGFLYLMQYAHNTTKNHVVIKYTRAGYAQTIELPCENKWTEIDVICSEIEGLDPFGGGFSLDRDNKITIWNLHGSVCNTGTENGFI